MVVPSRRITILYDRDKPQGQRFQYLDTTVVPPQNVWSCHAKPKAFLRWVCFEYAFCINFIDPQMNPLKIESPLPQAEYCSNFNGNMHHCGDQALSSASGVYPYTVRVFQDGVEIDKDDPEILIDDGGMNVKEVLIAAGALGAGIAVGMLLSDKGAAER